MRDEADGHPGDRAVCRALLLQHGLDRSKTLVETKEQSPGLRLARSASRSFSGRLTCLIIRDEQ